MIKLNVVKEEENPHFSITIIIDKDNVATIVDNSVTDWHDLVDCNTLIVKQIKLQP